LGHPLAVAEVNEDDATQVAAAVDPAHHQHTLAFIGDAQRSAMVGSAKIAQKIQ
jgi:hypothetical protein